MQAEQTTTYNANPASHCFRWQVLPELGADATTIAMGTSDFAPDDAQMVLLGVARGCRQSDTVIAPS